MAIINIRHKDDLITLDLTLKQIRYLTDPDHKGFIDFINLSSDDVEAYDYLFKEDKRLFLKTLKEDIKSFINKDIELKSLKVI